MQEAGIDISHHTSGHVEKYLMRNGIMQLPFAEKPMWPCPAFAVKVKHQFHIGFDVPSYATRYEEFIRSEFLRARDEIHSAFRKLYEEEIKPELR